jgi:CheY-like chemotaxis protein
VNADRVRLAQCIGNLLTNAAKYTDVGGKIWMRTRVEGENAVIEVSDNGQGIASGFLPHMFELFAQSDRALDRSQGGLGIGLSVCKQLIEAQGGSVSGESEGPGHGATFTLRIPVAKPVESAASPITSLDSAHRILIVDDNRDAADAMAMLLQLDGHDVQTAYSAEAALECLVGFIPSVALLDIGLPAMNGYELARTIRGMAIPQPTLIALSGYGQKEDKARATEAGFDAHLTKPVEILALTKALSDLRPGVRD